MLLFIIGLRWSNNHNAVCTHQLLRAFPVDRRVGDPKNEDAGLIEPLRLTGSL
jgi:hypothetical protein